MTSNRCTRCLARHGRCTRAYRIAATARFMDRAAAVPVAVVVCSFALLGSALASALLVLVALVALT